MSVSNVNQHNIILRYVAFTGTPQMCQLELDRYYMATIEHEIAL